MGITKFDYILILKIEKKWGNLNEIIICRRWTGSFRSGCGLSDISKYIVDAVYDGEEAYDYAISSEYDGIILDIMMPKKDGLEVLSALRRNGCKTPILRVPKVMP